MTLTPPLCPSDLQVSQTLHRDASKDPCIRMELTNGNEEVIYSKNMDEETILQKVLEIAQR